MKILSSEVYAIHMQKNLHTTTVHETVIPVTYIDTYSDLKVKAVIHAYKFDQDITAKKTLARILIDICIETILLYTNHQDYQLYNTHQSYKTHIYSCPPSTMYTRREKPIDSMWSLLIFVKHQLSMYVKKPLKTRVLYLQIFHTCSSFIRQRRAQHIDSTRQSRTTNTENRYVIRFTFKIYMYVLIAVQRDRSFSFYIIDDVTSTGGTLLACTQTLTRYMNTLQKKKPNISFNIQVFSLTH